MFQSYGKNQISWVPRFIYRYFFLVIWFYLFCKHLLFSQVIFQPIKLFNFERIKVFKPPRGLNCFQFSIVVLREDILSVMKIWGEKKKRNLSRSVWLC